MRSFAWGCLLAACGRIGFDPIAGSSSGNGSPDAFPLACPVATSVPDPITYAGTAYRPATGIHQSGVTVAAATSAGGAPIATTTTSSIGDFSLAIPTGGQPIFAYISYAKSGFVTSMSSPDGPLDRDVSSVSGFMGTPTDVSSLYSTGGIAQDPSKGTLLVVAVDCAAAKLGGVQIAVSPPAGKIVYSDSVGLPSATATSTGPSGFAWALDVPTGTVELSATKAGLTFVTHPVSILDGSYFMGTGIRPMP